MIDYAHIPDRKIVTESRYLGFSATDGGSWQTWEKPRGSTMLRITCIAGGGGGGSGYKASGGAGGSGGGSSAISIIMIPADCLPDVLYVSVGVGGAGGAVPADNAATLGSNGIRTYVSVAPFTGVIYSVCYADSGKAGTTAATSTLPGGAGAGGTVATRNESSFSSYGISNYIGGHGGGSGGQQANAPATYSFPTTGIMLSGGVGGPGTNNTFGGAITAPSQPSLVFFSSQARSASTVGHSGIEIQKPLLSTGGFCDRNYTNVAGNGGFGSGGAGSGAGLTAPAGGNGGPGLVIIHAW